MAAFKRLAVITLALAACTRAETLEDKVRRLADIPLTFTLEPSHYPAVAKVLSGIPSYGLAKEDTQQLPWNSATQCWNGDTISCGREFVTLLDSIVTEAMSKGAAGKSAVVSAALAVSEGKMTTRNLFDFRKFLFTALSDRLGTTRGPLDGQWALLSLAVYEVLLSRPGWKYARNYSIDVAQRTVGLSGLLDQDETVRKQYAYLALSLGYFRTAQAIFDLFGWGVGTIDEAARYLRYCKDQPLSVAVVLARVPASNRHVREWIATTAAPNMRRVAADVAKIGSIASPSNTNACAEGGIAGNKERMDALNAMESIASKLDDQYERAIVAVSFLHAIYYYRIVDVATFVERYTDTPGSSSITASQIARQTAESLCK